MENDELLMYRIGLTLINGIGNITAKNLINAVGSEEGVFREKKSALTRIYGIGEVHSKEIVNQQVLSRAEKEVNFIRKHNLSTYYYDDENYPERLKACNDAPRLLYSNRDLDLNNGIFLAVVGTRHASEYGKDMTNQLIKGLSEKIPEIQIVSGLAYGIDIAAHKAALENKMRTLGVVAHGLDRLYPSQHRAVALQMSENGGVLTEFISQTNPDRPNFVQRNRIIAGLCQALVVVESGAKGGALITADMAFNYDRDVFAFPGRVNDNWSVGCNALIRQNKAGLITSAEDLIMMMQWDQSREVNKPIQKKLFVELTEDEEKIVQIVQNNQDGVQINELTYLIPIPYSRISSILLSLEFKSVIKCFPGGLYKLC